MMTGRHSDPGATHYRTAMIEGVEVFYREAGPPTLVTAGVNDEVFPGEVQRQILTDLPAAEFHALDTGHCALEDQAPEIARLMRGFLDRVLAPEVTRTRS
ncbi:MAG: alpha/beta fold hydrolase [Streptosporangiaceae bacterium]